LDTIAVFLSPLKAGDVVRYTPLPSMEGADAINEEFVVEEEEEDGTAEVTDSESVTGRGLN
jgi:hypothetical protein